MVIKQFKPTSPGRRFQTVLVREEITQEAPEKSLLRSLSRSGGRNNRGAVTSRHRGGRHKRRYRVVDFRREKFGVPAKVASIEYDPNRSAHLALLHYRDGEKRYIVAPLGLRVGDVVSSGPEAEIRVGNALPLERIPPGTIIHAIELRPGKGAQVARSAGAGTQLLAKEGDYAHVRLGSGEVRLVSLKCLATIGQVGNTDHENVSVGKAGRSRWLGRRPRVRGVAMNPIDHPHGGGEGKSSGGRHPVTPWGVPTKGFRTRKSKLSDRLIIRRRSQKKGRG